MPYVNGVEMTPDEAMAANCCPECGRDLTKVNPISELNSHWKAYPVNNRDGEEALRRRAMLVDFIERNHVKTATPQ